MLKRAHDAQIVRAKENLKLSHGGPSQKQGPGTNPPMKVLGSCGLIHIPSCLVKFFSRSEATALTQHFILCQNPMVPKDEYINNYKCYIYKLLDNNKIKLKCTYSLFCLWEKKYFNCATNVVVLLAILQMLCMHKHRNATAFNNRSIDLASYM